ncbi:MAG: hypothetical protein LZ173_09775 [Thaumarchaeota archaeon]|nr:hypothetical protein [Candidatus Geocrenenecus arthurdayi]
MIKWVIACFESYKKHSILYKDADNVGELLRYVLDCIRLKADMISIRKVEE